jgi:cytochrome b561
MKSRTVYLLWLDCSMLLAVVLLESLSLTGLQLHEWLGFVLCPLVLLHVVLQWQWFMTQFQHVLRAGAWRVRVNACLNLLLLIAMAAVLVSGGLVSNQSIATFGERFGRLRLWSEIHGDLNFVLVVLVGLHLALNWDWILAALRRWRTKRTGVLDTASRKVTDSSSQRFVQFIRWFGRATAVLAVAFITAGGIYFAMTGITRRQEQRQSRSSSEFRPQGRRQSLSDGMRELSVTTATVAIAAIIGRRVFRLRL